MGAATAVGGALRGRALVPRERAEVDFQLSAVHPRTRQSASLLRLKQRCALLAHVDVALQQHDGRCWGYRVGRASHSVTTATQKAGVLSRGADYSHELSLPPLQGVEAFSHIGMAIIDPVDASITALEATALNASD